MKTFTLLLLSLLSVSSFAEDRLRVEADATKGCAPLTVNFLSVSELPNATWQWDFGNVYTSNQKCPTVVFLEAGVYRCVLRVTNRTEADSVVTSITVFDKPKANFQINKAKACSGEQVWFSNTTESCSAPISKSIWATGDGKNFTQTDLQYSYKEQGNYWVTLVVNDANGCSSSKTLNAAFEVMQSPKAEFSMNPVASCEQNQLVQFKNSSFGNITSAFWNFDDSSTSSDKNLKEHLFRQGKYRVMLAVSDANSCKDTFVETASFTKLKADFLVSKESACTGETVKFINSSNFKGTKWAWDFGDGTTSSLCNPSKQYNQSGNYNVALKLWDGECFATETKTAVIKIGDGNPVSFQSEVNSPCSGNATVKFKNENPNAVLYLWTFGDGTASTEPNPVKTYSKEGSYTVSLAVTDRNGCTTEKRMKDYIQSSSPRVDFTADTFSCPGYPVKFSNFTNNATSFTWSFGDGDTSSKANPAHVYKKNGVYTVTLKSVNNKGCETVFSKKNFVRVDTLKVDFEMTSTKALSPPFVCSFENKTKVGGAKYIWDFGDGTSDTKPNPDHIYNYPGNFDVRLVAYTRNGCTNSKLLNHTIEMGSALAAPMVGPDFDK
jgi:PKD repeat protein